MSDIKDLINYAINQKPTDFSSTFQELLLNKLQNAVTDRKVQIAQGIFPEVETVETEEEEDDNG